jgi:hypothetical protein
MKKKVTVQDILDKVEDRIAVIMCSIAECEDEDDFRIVGCFEDDDEVEDEND